jgi:GntR family transcriptional repressor for pyruvate dehydrogenase complex
MAESLGKQIRSGAFAPGQMLPSTQALAEEASVSRTVVREALARLAFEGLVSSRQGLGVFAADVLPPEKLSFPATAVSGDIGKILELRLGIETEAAALAARRRTKRHVERMKAILATMDVCVQRNEIEKGIKADLEFHRAICIAAGNDYFEKIFTFLSQYLHDNISVSRRKSATIAGRGMQAQEEHRAIFSAVSEGEVERARQLMRKHIFNTAMRLELKIEADADGKRRV